jgi:hypothetical protein
MASFPTEYDDGSQCEFAIMDRLTCLDYTVRLWEMKAYEPAASGTTRMRYPIQKIEIIMSIKAGIVKEYLVDVDFTIDNGRILWVAGKEPSYNTILLCLSRFFSSSNFTRNESDTGTYCWTKSCSQTSTASTLKERLFTTSL